jgi:hypothetical protein
MHVLQYIAVRAEDEDMAMRVAEDTLNSEMGGNEYAHNSWYDWFVIGGGRFVEGDPYKSSTNHIISYAKHGREGIQEKVDWAIEARKTEYANYMKSVDYSKILDTLDSYTGNTDYSMSLYPVAKCIDMLQGSWDFNSYFYDAETGSTNFQYMLDKLDESWYLIPVDFHF